MCTVFAYSGTRLGEEGLMALLSETRMRGPDMQRIVSLGSDGVMAFQRLSIMGLDEAGMQPFVNDGITSVTNGELYGFRPVRRQLEEEGCVFHSDSDCELVNHLYRKYGVRMFQYLDAEFATIIHDPSAGFIAARDPIGIRPLFYGYDQDGKIAFASEARMLEGLCGEILPFPPGRYYVNGEFHIYNDISHVSSFTQEDEETVTSRIREKLIAAVDKRLDSDAPVGFLLSGGLDSSLVCAIASRILGRPIRTFAIGMDKDPIDARYAQIVADHIKSEHTLVSITRDDALGALEEVIRCLATWDITTIRASVGMYLLCKYIHEHTDIRVLLTGEVSDELFGYKYTDFAPNAEEFQKESEKRVRELYCYDVLRADRCIADNSMEARVPFGDLDFASYVLSVRPELKMNRTGIGKYLLRKAFDDGSNWLPQSILYRQKAAFSDAVGHSLVDDLKAYADEVFCGRDWKAMCSAYPEAGRPFTKESLLYRTIFEKYYPGQSAMIPDFWMPNRQWEGCRVDDPSARVLSNYGDSGK